MPDVTKGKVVLIHYTLTNSEGEELDSSRGGEPLPYLHGHDNIVPGLEKALDGKDVGFRETVVVAPADGYGEHSGFAPQAVPRDAFPADMPLEEGMSFVVENEMGDQIPVWIAGLQDDVVLLDTNHPLAGVELHFDVEVAGVRDATPDELLHGHPHGLDGDDDHEH
ncbi:MAG: peptidylprolyl isomerase [Deltaproteobacteria bacterium]|nr:MAG: peptidylprolyl isomerase [Deltaproteobacteria bacterium]